MMVLAMDNVCEPLCVDDMRNPDPVSALRTYARKQQSLLATDREELLKFANAIEVTGV